MADYIVTSGELTTVANAIRAKNGTSSNLSWPDGFVSGISSGGGGSSDFSTAEVTIINTIPSSTGTLMGLPYIIEDEIRGSNKTVQQGTSTVTAVLFKGVLYCSIDCEEITSSEGSVEVDDVDLTIRGDCTITIKGYPDA